MTDPLTVSPP